MEKKQISFNEAYVRMMLLNDIRTLEPCAKALSETLILRVHYGSAITKFAMEQQTIESDPQGDEDTKKAAVKTRAAEDSGCSDRRFTQGAFEQIVEAALTAKNVRTFLADEPVPAAEWLDAIAARLVEA